MVYNNRLGEQTDQNNYGQNSQIDNLSEMNSELFLDGYRNAGDTTSRSLVDQQLGLIQLENLVNELKKENFSLKMKIFFYEDGMKYLDTKDDSESAHGNSFSKSQNIQNSNEFITKFQQMEQTIESLQKLLEKEKLENAKLQEDRQKLFKTYESLEQQLNLLRKKSDKSLENDNALTEKYHQLEANYNDLQENYKKINDLLEQEKNEKEDLITSNNNLEQYCTELQQQNNDLEKKCDDLQNEYLLCNQRIKKNKDELHNSLEMQKEVENLKNQEIEFCHKQIEALQKDLSDSEEKIDSLKKDIQHDQEIIQQLNEIKSNLTEKNIRASQNLKDTNEELQNELKKNKQLQEDLENLKQNKDKKLELNSLQNEMDRIRKEADHLHMELQQSNINYKELSDEYNAMKKNYENQISLINEFKSEKDEDENIIENLNNQIRQLNLKNKALSEKLNKNIENNSDNTVKYINENADLRSQVELQRKLIDDLNKEIENFKKELIEIQDELDKEIEEHELLKDHANKIEKENELLNKELIEMKNNKTFEKSNTDKKLFEAYRREQILHDTIENNSLRVEKIMEEKEKIQKENEKLNEAIHALNQKLDDNDSERAKLKDNITQKNETINKLQNKIIEIQRNNDLSFSNMELLNSSNNTIILLNKEIENLKKENENLMNAIKNKDNNKSLGEDTNTEYLIKIFRELEAMRRNFKINEDTITDLHKLNGAQGKELETHYKFIEKLQNNLMKTQQTINTNEAESEIIRKEAIIRDLREQLNKKIEELEKIKITLKELESENESLLRKSVIDIDPNDIEELKEMNKGLKRELLFKNSYVEELKLEISAMKESKGSNLDIVEKIKELESIKEKYICNSEQSSKLLEQVKQANILNANLKEENERNKKDISTYEEEIKRINKENVSLKNAYNDSKLKLHKLESEMASHSCDKEVNKSINARSKINEIKYQETIDELTSENKELKSKLENQIEKNKQDIQYEQLLNKKYKEDIEDYKRQIEYNEEKIKKLQNNISNLNKENETQKEEMNEIQKKLRNLQDSYNDLLNENKNLRIKIHEKSNEIYDIQDSKTIRLLYNTISDFSNSINNKSVDESSSISNSVPELVSSLRNIAISFNKNGSVLSDVFSNLTKQFIYLLNQAKDNDQRRTELLNEIEKLKKDLDEINSKLEKEINNNNELTKTNKNLKDKVNSYVIQIQDKNNQISNLNGQVSNMNKQLIRMKPDSLVDSLQKRIQETNSKLETIGSEYKKMENENNKLKTSIKSINEQYSTTKKESKERSIEISVLKEKLEKEGQNCEELKSQQISLLEENSSLKSKYKKINEMNRMLQEESKQLNEQIMVLKKTLKNERPNIKIDEYYLLLNQIFATIQNMLPENLKSPIKTFDLSTDIKTYKKCMLESLNNIYHYIYHLIEDMKEKCKEMIDKKQDAMNKKFYQFQSQLNKRMSQFSTYQSKIARATEYQKHLKDTLYEKENEIKRLNENIRNHNEQLRELENKAKKIEQDYSKVFKGVSKDMLKDKMRVYTDLEKQLIREREDAHETAKELINRLNASEKQLERSKSALSYLKSQKDNKSTNKYISKLEKEKQLYEKERAELFNEINKKSETIKKYKNIIEKTLTKLEQEDIINFMGAFQQACDIMRKDLPENSILNP